MVVEGVGEGGIVFLFFLFVGVEAFFYFGKLFLADPGELVGFGVGGGLDGFFGGRFFDFDLFFGAHVLINL